MLPESTAGDSMQAALVAAIRGSAVETETEDGFSAMLLGAGVPGDDLAALATCGARDRFRLYRELVHNRFRGVLEVSIPRALARAGAARVSADLDAFIAVRASRSRYLRDVAGEFVGFVSERWQGDPRVPRYLPELAQHELLCFEIGAAENDPPHAATEITVDSRLRFQGPARLVRYAYAVHLLEEEDDASIPEERSTSLLAYRDGDGCGRFLELSPLATCLLTRLMCGRPSARRPRPAWPTWALLWTTPRWLT